MDHKGKDQGQDQPGEAHDAPDQNDQSLFPGHRLNMMCGDDLGKEDSHHGEGMNQTDDHLAFRKETEKDRQNSNVGDQASTECEEDTVQPPYGGVPLVMPLDGMIVLFQRSHSQVPVSPFCKGG